MILTITFLIAAWLHPAQPTVVAQLQEPRVQGIALREPIAQGIELAPAHPTVVKTWGEK